MPSPTSATAESRRKRILIRATNWIGDSVMTMPAVQRLRELYPNAQLVLLCPAKLRDLWNHNPHLDEVAGFEEAVDPDWVLSQEFDAAIVFPNSFRAAWEVFRARIPERIGYPGHGRRLLLTRVAPESNQDRAGERTVTVDGKSFRVKSFTNPRHQVHRYLDLVRFLGGNGEYVDPRIWLAPEDLPSVAQRLPEDGRPVVALQTGAEYGPAKRWFPERFAAVALAVADRVSCRWLLLGGKGDVEIARLVQAKLLAGKVPVHDVVNVAGQTSLVELFALLRRSRLLLTNDTGPMHVAAALGTPVVAVFGSTSAELTGPLNRSNTVVQEPVECSPCFLRECPVDFRCMKRIEVDRVAAAVLARLDHR